MAKKKSKKKRSKRNSPKELLFTTTMVDESVPFPQPGSVIIVASSIGLAEKKLDEFLFDEGYYDQENFHGWNKHFAKKKLIEAYEYDYDDMVIPHFPHIGNSFFANFQQV